MKVYKIRNEEGKFSTGGSHPSFTKNGKVWANIGHVKNHINNIVRSYGSVHRYQNAFLVTYEVVEEEKEVVPLNRVLVDGKLK